MRAAMRGLVLVGAVALFGCGTGRFVARGIHAYKVGDYPNAAEQFDWIEREGVMLNDQGHCRFLVYRGLTLVHLGKKDTGLALLAKGKAECSAIAGDLRWLPPEIAQEMEETLAKAGR